MIDSQAKRAEHGLSDRLEHHRLALLRALCVALAALVLSYAGQLSLALAPWSAIALPTGLAIGAYWRWGRSALLGAVLGVLLAVLASGMDWHGAVLAAFVVAGVPLAVRAALQPLGFDARMERPVDIGMLLVAVAMCGALPAALLAGAWVNVTTGQTPLVAVLSGYFLLGVGMLATAICTLATDRHALQLLQPGLPRRDTAVGLAAVALMLWLLWLAPTAHSPVAALALFLPHVVLAALALRGQFVIAAGGLLAAGLLGASSASNGLSLWAGGGSVKAALAAWIGSAMAVMLLAHTARADWRGRSQRWEWALDGSRLGVADWHLQRDESFASAAWRTLTSHSARHWQPEAWQQQVHAEDRPRLAEAIASLVGGETGRRELELRFPDGSGWRWFEATLMVIERDGGGQPVRLLATLADVQDRRQAQERQLMSVSLFQHLHEGLLITDADLRALDANPAYTQILGVPRDELLGTVPSLLRPAPADPVARQQRAAMWAGLRDNGSWRGELLERRRNGDFCTLQATISTVRGPQQDLRYHVLVISDITQQQSQREQLERQAHFDELTRLPNRARLSQLLDDAMLAADRDGYLLVVCYLDLDRFKPVNDRFGHAAGDRLLAELAGRLRSALRSRESWAD